jgi:hypothetical protein
VTQAGDLLVVNILPLTIIHTSPTYSNLRLLPSPSLAAQLAVAKSSSPDYDRRSDADSSGAECTKYSYPYKGIDDDCYSSDKAPLPVAKNRIEDSRTDFVDSTATHTKVAQEDRCDKTVETIISPSTTFLAGFSALPQEVKNYILDYTLSFDNVGQNILVTCSPMIKSAEQRTQ